MPHASEIAQHGGAALAVSSAAIGAANSLMGWLNSNSPGILALCAITGAFISWRGSVATKKHQAELLQNELRQKQRRMTEQAKR